MADEFKPLNLAQLYQGADAAVAQAMQTNLLVLQSSRMKQEFDTEDRLRDLAKSSTTTDASGNPTFDLKAFTRGAYSIDPLKAQGFEKNVREAEKADLENTKLRGDIQNTQEQVDERRMKNAGERLKVLNEASTVPYLKYKELVDGGMPDADARAKVQPLYESALRGVATSGFFKPEEMSKMKIMNTPQFDPTVAEAGMRQVLGAKDSLAQYWNERNDKQKERFHSDEMKIQIRGQDVTLRGQDLTDARAKESLANQGIEVKENADGTYNLIDKKTGTATDVVDKMGKPVQGKSSLTESQGKAVGFGQRAVAAHDIITQLENSGTTGKLAAVKQGVGNVPLVGGALEAGANKMLPADQQKIEQAQRDFINAVLRPESGATISPQEFENARKQYFAQPGDSDAVIKQKQDNREREIKAIRSMAGPGSKQIPESGAAKKADDKAGAAGAVSVPAPDGKTYSFPDQAAADKFKKAAGIQ